MKQAFLLLIATVCSTFAFSDPEEAVVEWVLFDTPNECWKQDKELINRIFTESRNKIPAENYFSVGTRAALLSEESQEENAPVEYSFQSALSSAFKKLSMSDEPVLHVAISTHALEGAMLRQYGSIIPYPHLIQVILNEVEKFKKNVNKEPTVKIYLCACYSGSVIAEMAEAISDEYGLYTNGTTKYKRKVDILTSAPGDRMSIGNREKGNNFWRAVLAAVNLYGRFSHKEWPIFLAMDDDARAFSSYAPLEKGDTKKEIIVAIQTYNLRGVKSYIDAETAVWLLSALINREQKLDSPEIIVFLVNIISSRFSDEVTAGMAIAQLQFIPEKARTKKILAIFAQPLEKVKLAKQLRNVSTPTLHRWTLTSTDAQT